MRKTIYLVLTMEVGNVDEFDYDYSTNPKDWEEYFYQADLIHSELNLEAVVVRDVPE